MGHGYVYVPAGRHNAEVRVSLLADGTVRVVCATQDIGTGTYTVFAEVVSDRTGVPLDKIRVQLGDTALRQDPLPAGLRQQRLSYLPS